VLRQAQDLTATHVVTAICFGPTWHRRRHQFLADGLWLIDGGLYGPGRTKRSFAPAPMQIAKEIAVLAGFRPTTP
jgi:hypothetical protein